MSDNEVVVHLERSELAPVAELRTLSGLRILQSRWLLFELQEQVDFDFRCDLAFADFVGETGITSADWLVSIILGDMTRKNGSYFSPKDQTARGEQPLPGDFSQGTAWQPSFLCWCFRA